MPFDIKSFLGGGTNAPAAGAAAGQGFDWQRFFASAAGDQATVARIDQRRQEDKDRARQFKALMEYGDASGILSKDQALTMDADSLKGFIEGTVAKRKLQEELQTFEAKREEQNTAKRLNAAVREFMSPDPETTRPAPTGPDLLRLAAGADALTPQLLNAFLQQQDTPVDWEAISPREKTLPSGSRVLYGASGQFQLDPGQFMEGVGLPDVEGYTTVPGKTGPRFIRDREPKTLPDSYNTRLDKLDDEIRSHEDQAALSDAEIAGRKSYRGRDYYKQAAAAAHQKKAGLLESYRAQGYGNDEFWHAEYARHGLTPPAAASTPASPRGEGKRAAAGSSRVRVKDPTGKLFTVPAEQLEEARRQGYVAVE